MNALLKNLLVGTLIVGSLAMANVTTTAKGAVPPHHHHHDHNVVYRSTVYINNPGEWGGPVNFSTSCNGGPWSDATVFDGGQVQTSYTAENRPAQIKISFDNGAGQTHTYDVYDGWTYKFGRDANGNLDLYNN